MHVFAEEEEAGQSWYQESPTCTFLPQAAYAACIYLYFFLSEFV